MLKPTDPHKFFIAWSYSFLFTLAVEIPIYVLVARRSVPARRAALAAALCSAVTHPLLWFVWPRFFKHYTTYIVSGELIVAVVEALIFWAVARPKRFLTAVAASFLANAGSYGLGVLFHYLHWM